MRRRAAGGGVLRLERRLPTEDEWEHAARGQATLGLHGLGGEHLEWTSSPYCYFCGRSETVVRGVPGGNPGKRGFLPPSARDARLGFRCAR